MDSVGGPILIAQLVGEQASVGLANVLWLCQLAQRAARQLPEIAFTWEQHIPFWAWTIVPISPQFVLYVGVCLQRPSRIRCCFVLDKVKKHKC